MSSGEHFEVTNSSLFTCIVSLHKSVFILTFFTEIIISNPSGYATLAEVMKVIIKRFDQSLPLPEYKSTGAAALDLYAREKTVIKPGQVGYVPLNIALQIPEGYWVLLSARSSLHKRGVIPANGIGVGDYDYRGDGDEYQAALLNFTQEDVMIERGERIVQMIILSREKVEFTEAIQFEEADRGGFGSTGKKI